MVPHGVINYVLDGDQLVIAPSASAFHTIDVVASGNSPIWTPGVGKTIRLMGYSISVSGTCAALSSVLIQLRDGTTTPIKQHRASVNTTITGDTQIVVDLGTGELLTAPDNVLNLNLSVALTAGGVSVNAWGTEE